MSPVILLLFLAFVGVSGWLCFSLGTKYSEQRQVRLQDVQDNDKILELTSLYLDVVLKHGPDSSTAEAYRFGVDNKVVGLDDPSKTVFHSITRVIDETVKRNSNVFK